MRERSPGPAASRYATSALTPSTSRNSRLSAPGTTAARQVAPPSVVRAYVPLTPLTQTTRSSTALTACKRFFVPLTWAVNVGLGGATEGLSVEGDAREQPLAAASASGSTSLRRIAIRPSYGR